MSILAFLPINPPFLLISSFTEYAPGPKVCFSVYLNLYYFPPKAWSSGGFSY